MIKESEGLVVLKEEFKKSGNDCNVNLMLEDLKESFLAMPDGHYEGLGNIDLEEFPNIVSLFKKDELNGLIIAAETDKTSGVLEFVVDVTNGEYEVILVSMAGEDKFNAEGCISSSDFDIGEFKFSYKGKELAYNF